MPADAIDRDPKPAPAGPLLHATLVTADADRTAAAYRRAFGLQIAGESRRGGERLVDLLPQGGTSTLLRLLERPGAPPRPTRFSHGWLALEILVRDVDAIARGLPGAADFEVIGPPADLELSPAIRAMQVVGPAGEMLYLTQITRPVPPFVLPLSADLPAGRSIGPLFIAVLSTPSRADTLARCEALAPLAALQFDTKVTVLNRALGRPIDHRWPLATTQWAGASLFEIDEVVDAKVATPAAGAPPAGLSWITIAAPRDGFFEVSPGAWLECISSAREHGGDARGPEIQNP